MASPVMSEELCVMSVSIAQLAANEQSHPRTHDPEPTTASGASS